MRYPERTHAISGRSAPLPLRAAPFLARRWFRAPIHDVYCGLRGFTRELYGRLDQRCTGMEFATEMIIKASLARSERLAMMTTFGPAGGLLLSYRRPFP